MAHCSHQQSNNGENTRRLIIAFAIISTFMVVEIVGGLISGSLALLADAAHMLTDAFALALAISAQYLSRRPADSRLHFGYRRAQVLAAFVNGIFLAVLLVWILFEAVGRFLNPQPVDVNIMLSVAALGFAANAAAFAILHHGHDHETDVNMRGALLHIIGDLLGSAVAIIAAFSIMAFGWLRIDPILSILVAGLIGVSAVRLVRETGFILLEGAPKDIDLDELKAGLKRVSTLVKDVHHLQISQITPDQPRLTMHACVEKAEHAAEALAALKTALDRDYQIRQSTIQIEVGSDCPDRALERSLKAVRASENRPTYRSSASRQPASPAAVVASE